MCFTTSHFEAYRVNWNPIQFSRGFHWDNNAANCLHCGWRFSFIIKARKCVELIHVLKYASRRTEAANTNGWREYPECEYNRDWIIGLVKRNRLKSLTGGNVLKWVCVWCMESRGTEQPYNENNGQSNRCKRNFCRCFRNFCCQHQCICKFILFKKSADTMRNLATICKNIVNIYFFGRYLHCESIFLIGNAICCKIASQGRD